MLVKPVITAIQSHGVIANAKHWVMNSQETDRMTIDEFVDERTRFEMCVRPPLGLRLQLRLRLRGSGASSS